MRNAWARAPGIVLTTLCLVFGPLIYVSSKGATGAMLALALAALWADPAPKSALLRSFRRLLPLAPLLLWMLVSSLWALVPGGSASLALRLAGLALGGVLLAGQFLDLPVERLRRPVMALAIGLTIAAAAVALDLWFGGDLGRAMHPPAPEDYDPALFYARAATLHAVFVIPLLVALIRLRATALGALHTLVTVVALFETASLSAKITIGLGLAVLLAVYAVPRLRWAGLGALTLAMISLPLFFPLQIGAETSCWLIDHKPSALHRVMIWNFVTDHIRQKPVAGWGLDAARSLPGGKEKLELRYCPPSPIAGIVSLSSETLPLHPHNGILQIWLELGGIGALLAFAPFVLAIAAAFRRQAWRTRATQAMLAASIASALSVSLVSFGIWQEWFLAGLFLDAGLAVLAARLAFETETEGGTNSGQIAVETLARLAGEGGHRRQDKARPSIHEASKLRCDRSADDADLRRLASSPDLTRRPELN